MNFGALKFFTLVVAFSVCGLLPGACADEMVTIPKARLQELERKEAELERLTGRSSKAAQPIPQKVEPRENAATNAPSSVKPLSVAHPSPPPVALSPYKEAQIVEAVDLANDYAADVAVADQRYRKRRFTVRGEVTGFEKPMFRRDYRILLKTGMADRKVICEFFPPDTVRNVLTTGGGAELVSVLAGETQVSLAKVGQVVEIEGLGLGLKNSNIRLTSCEVKGTDRSADGAR